MASLDAGGHVRTKELFLLFQPQMSADGTRIMAVEALVRQLHPTRGEIGPGEILRTLKTAARREALDWWVLGEACQVMSAWEHLPVSVNMTATQLRRPDFGQRVLSVIESFGIPPQRIEIEILKRLHQGFRSAVANIAVLREAGVRVALDDFGTGYSSLAYLMKMPIDKLKLDKSFIDGIGSIQAASIIQAVTALARALGLKVTAEGVETPEQQRFLKAVGCHYLQGYPSRPRPRCMRSRACSGSVRTRPWPDGFRRSSSRAASPRRKPSTVSAVWRCSGRRRSARECRSRRSWC